MSESLSNGLIKASLAWSERWLQLTDRELAWCLRSQRLVHHRPVIAVFAVVSRLGDGLFWYGLMAMLLLVHGAAAAPVVARMLLAGAVCLVLYKWLKARTTRSRPCARSHQIQLRAPALDEYSFPSGHTLHAVSFTLIAVYHYPALSGLLVPFATLVALSRIVLGLHYPSDVLAGAVLGAGLAFLALHWSFI